VDCRAVAGSSADYCIWVMAADSFVFVVVDILVVVDNFVLVVVHTLLVADSFVFVVVDILVVVDNFVLVAVDILVVVDSFVLVVVHTLLVADSFEFVVVVGRGAGMVFEQEMVDTGVVDSLVQFVVQAFLLAMVYLVHKLQVGVEEVAEEQEAMIE